MKIPNKFHFILYLIPLTLLGIFVIYQDIFFLLISILSGVIINILLKPRTYNEPKVSSKVASPKVHKKIKIPFVGRTSLLIKGRREYGFIITILLIIFALFIILFFSYYPKENLLFAFYHNLFNELKTNIVFLAVVVMITTMWIGLVNVRDSFKNRLGQLMGVLLLSIHGGLILVIVIAVFHILGVGLYLNYFNGMNMYLTDLGRIKSRIEESKEVPQVKVLGGNPNAQMFKLFVPEFLQDSYYQDNLINTLPQFVFSLYERPQSSMTLVNNTLFISSIENEDIELMAPVLAKRMIRHTYDSKNIKDEPNIQIISRQEYLKMREKQINDQVAELEEDLDSLGAVIADYRSAIARDNAALNKYKADLVAAPGKKASDYEKCTSAGYLSPYTGIFYPSYTDEYCRSRASLWDEYIAGLNMDIQNIQSVINSNQYELNIYLELYDYMDSNISMVEAQKVSTPNELGIFLPEKQIKIALDTNQVENYSDFMTTTVHEYLHYTTYISDERQLPHFFEEALTEYFSRKVIKNELDIQTKLGYPLYVSIVEGLMKDIPEEEFLDIYFTKDSDQLEYLLNQEYGDDFYESSELYFEIIGLLPRSEALKVANNILLRIGEKRLSEDDLVSEESEFNVE